MEDNEQNQDVNDNVIHDQLMMLYDMRELDFSALYDKWEEEKIKVVSTAMSIIQKRQKEILKGIQ